MDYTKEELEVLLKAFKILKQHEVNDRLSLTSIETEIKEKYIETISKDL